MLFELFHHFTPPKSNTMFSTATTTLWLNSHATLPILMVCRKLSTPSLPFTHFSNMSKFVAIKTSQWLGYKFPHTESYKRSLVIPLTPLTSPFLNFKFFTRSCILTVTCTSTMTPLLPLTPLFPTLSSIFHFNYTHPHQFHFQITANQ